MDIKWLIADILYIALIMSVFAMLPASFTSGQTILDADDISGNTPNSFDDAQNTSSFKNIMTLFFTTWNADGMPNMIAFFIAILNWISIMIIVFYIIELVWW